MNARSLFALLPKLYGSEVINKLMGIASIGSSFANVALLQHFLEGIVSVIALTIFGAMMATMLLTTAFYAGYVSLVGAGLSQIASLWIIVVALALVTSALAAVTVWRFNQMKTIPYRAPSNDLEPVKKVASVAQAFVSGFLKRPSGSRRTF